VREVLPGIHHWTAFHEGIGFDVSSYYVAPARALIDPMLPPDGGVDALAELPEPQVVLLTNRHHYRHSARFAERYGCPVRCHESGLHEFEGRPEEVDGFAYGDEVAPGIVALELGAICPDDSALLVTEQGTLAFADGFIHWGGGKIGFVPDQYMGDDPEDVKRGLRASAKRLLAEQQFDSLLFAHGEPIVTGGHEALRAFVESE
jgi:hypothetical protein